MLPAYLYARFSDVRQAAGSSLDRQTGMAREWCEKNRYALAGEYRDEGVSGYRGKHREQGALADFLNDVERGLIPPGAAILIENPDRLSREAMWPFVALVSRLVAVGLRIVVMDVGPPRHHGEEVRGRLCRGAAAVDAQSH